MASLGLGSGPLCRPPQDSVLPRQPQASRCISPGEQGRVSFTALSPAPGLGPGHKGLPIEASQIREQEERNEFPV